MHPPLPKKVVPVTADMVTVSDHPQGKVTSTAKFFRDEDSRTRVEQGDTAVIHDPVKGESYVLKMPEKIAIPGKPEMPAMPKPPAVPSVPKPEMPKPAIPEAKPPELPEAADLGEKVIDGMKVKGKRFTMPQPPKPPGMPEAPKPPGAPQAPAMPQPPTAEVWTSPELKLPIQSSMIDPKTGARSVTEMKNIKPGVKLDPSMFEVPKDFKIAPPVKPPKFPGM
jgi:hypothetical protein